MKCPECGSENQKNARVCSKCGCNLLENSKTEKKNYDEKKQSKNTAFIVIVFASVLLVVGIAGLIEQLSGARGKMEYTSAENEKGSISGPVPENSEMLSDNIVSDIEGSVPQISAAFCPSGVNYYEFNSHTYAQFDYKERNLEKSYSAWEAYCESLGGHLATITSAEENAAVYNMIQKEGLTLAFFGYSDENSEGNWEWITGETSSYSNWESGQPNNGANDKKGRAQNYAQFSKNTADGQWNDERIGEDSWHFVCEWDEIITSEP